jgi:hypothetical protein
MAFTVGQAVQVGGESGTVVRLNPLGAKDSVVIQFGSGLQKAYIGASQSAQVVAQ